VQAPHRASRNALSDPDLRVARNRKRRSDRRSNRPSDARQSPPGVATARAGRRDEGSDPRRDENPDPIEHATPDVELAEAQLALGRPDLARQPPGEDDFDDAELTDDDFGGEGGDDDFGDGAGGGGSGSGRGGGASRGSGGVVPSPASGRSPWAGRRLVGFVQGSWRELQRVQWPDRRQVMQATGVVIGFVIVAGVFLGVADFVATKVVNLILK
jgi:preprotein translocase SecE subunit